MQVRIVLVEPREGGNAGAVARVMKNFGYRDLVIVGALPDTDQHSLWWAAGADDLLREARIAASLEEALAGCHLTVATTAIRGRHVFTPLTPPELAKLAAENLSEDQRLALVFGRETWGLTGKEIATCQRTAFVSTSPDYPTLNLAQCVGIFCYELRRPLAVQTQSRELPPHDLLMALEQHARDLLTTIGFFGDKSPDRMCAELQALAGRSLLTTREASLLLSMIRQLRQHIE